MAKMPEFYSITGYSLFEALDGLKAYDSGAYDSGINDDLLKEGVRKYLTLLKEDRRNTILSKFINEYYLTDEAIGLGYGIASVGEFIQWLKDELAVYV